MTGRQWLGYGVAALAALAAFGRILRRPELRPCCGEPVCGDEQRQAVPVPAGWRRLGASEVTPSDRAAADSLLSVHHDAPYGTVLSYASGRAVMIEQHCHEPGGGARPWGYHPGATLIART